MLVSNKTGCDPHTLRVELTEIIHPDGVAFVHAGAAARLVGKLAAELCAVLLALVPAGHQVEVAESGLISTESRFLTKK